ncbi:MAG TPA: GNAT family N-acetyltransferase [candidate division Zixibacteria bacterium]|nr:GNAT family N-acetyltransferase [candidate division Zixibacteria bacterium]
MEGTTRVLSISDYDSIIRLWADAGLKHKPKGRDSKESMQKEMQLDGVCYFGYYENDKLLGVGLANFDGRRGWINRIAVHPDHRGRGIGGILITECEKFLKSKGAVVLSALIEDINEPSMTCFEKAGFDCEKEWLYFCKRESPDA